MQGRGWALLAVAGALAAAGCQSQPARRDEPAATPSAAVQVPPVQAGYCESAPADTLCSAGFGPDIMRHLDRQDAAPYRAALERAVATGQPQTWRSPDTGHGGTVAAGPAPKRQAPVSVLVPKGRLVAVPPLDALGLPFGASGRTNVRGGPGTNFPVVDGLDRDEVVIGMGRVRGTDWILVARGDVGIGYVREDLLNPVPLDSPAAAMPGLGRTLDRAQLEEQAVDVAAECRAVDQSIEVADRSEQVAAVLCRAPTGWQRR